MAGLALYHLHVKNISRGGGRSAVSAAAYRAGETLPNDAEERESAFGGRRDVVFSEIRLPANAPGWMSGRAQLWNAVEGAEIRKDARLAKEIEFALPRGLPRAEWIAAARDMADAYVSQGYIVDLAVHDDGSAHNPHVHLMLTTRVVQADGFGPKIREADGKAFVTGARQTWQIIANKALAAAGVGTTIDARSHQARGRAERPGVHAGPDRLKRRERREGRGAMTLSQDLDEARRRFLAEPGISDRFPRLAGRSDWPPAERHDVSGLNPEERAEHRVFWQEVDRRALGVAGPHETEAVREPPISERLDDLYQQVRQAEREAGRERREAFVQAAPAYREMFERLNREMLAAGILRPQDIRSWEAISRAFRDDGFDRLLAEARALEAKRNEQAPPDRKLVPPAEEDWWKDLPENNPDRAEEPDRHIRSIW